MTTTSSVLEGVRFVDCDIRCSEKGRSNVRAAGTHRLSGIDGSWSQNALPVGKKLIAAQRLLGYDVFILTAIVPDGFKPSRWCIVSNVEPEYFKVYSELKLGLRDPVLEYGMSCVEPFGWDEIAGMESARFSAYDALNQRFGLRSGMTVPIRCPNGIHCFVSYIRRSAPPSDCQTNEMKLRAFGQSAPALQTFSKIVFDDIHDRDQLLSARERECLELSAQGMRSKQIAAHLSLSLSTVAFHIDRAVRKMGVNTRSAAIGKAVTMGQIQRAFGDGVIHFKVCEADLEQEGLADFS